MEHGQEPTQLCLWSPVKPIVAVGSGSSACMKLLLALVRDPVMVGLITSLERVGKGIRTPPRDAIILAELDGRDPGMVFEVPYA
ncbi:hypothetical protein [Methanopyrus sp.]